MTIMRGGWTAVAVWTAGSVGSHCAARRGKDMKSRKARSKKGVLQKLFVDCR